jgi:hypothetical protein
LNGSKRTAAGTAHGKDYITIYMNNVNPGFAKEVMAHEIAHIKFETFIQANFEKYKGLVADIGKFQKSDGVTDYSREYWTAYGQKQNFVTERSAFHETLAEIAAQEEKGLTVGAPEWRSLYDEVNSHWGKWRATV